MNILVVSSYLPYPLFSGGHIRLYNLLKELSKKHEITLICEKRAYQIKKDIIELEKLCKLVITFERKKQWSLVNIFKAGFSFYPFLLIGHMNKLMKMKIKELLEKEKFDLIHIETFYVIQNIPKTSIPIILAEHNIEYLVYDRFIRRIPVIFRSLLSIDVAKIKYWEEKAWERATKVIAVSEEEKKLILKKEVVVVPNGVDINQFKLRKSKLEVKDKKVLFIGDFKWMQNRDAVKWILTEIWPLINLRLNLSTSLRARDQNSKINLILWIVGRNIPQSIKNLKNNDNIIFDENAPVETYKIFEQADVLLTPIRIGGGTSFKILEAMASGVPVVTTSLGIEGIEAENNQEVLIADTKESMVNQVFAILENDFFYERIKKNARKLIEKKYDWKIIIQILENVYQSVIKNNL